MAKGKRVNIPKPGHGERLYEASAATQTSSQTSAGQKAMCLKRRQAFIIAL